MCGEDVKLFIELEVGDKRFCYEDWMENDVFNVIKQLYLVIFCWFMNMVDGVEGLDD